MHDQVPHTASGLTQRMWLNRAKSESTDTTGTPCSMASAASWASVTRLPRISRSVISRPRTSAVRAEASGTRRLARSTSARPEPRPHRRTMGGRTPGMGGDAQECPDGLPWKPDAVWAVESVGDPLRAAGVVAGAFVDRVEQDVCVKSTRRTWVLVGLVERSRTSATLDKSTRVPMSCVTCS